MAAIPDFSNLAVQQSQLNNQAANQTTLANRPNQNNQYGSLTWSQDPATGAWTQNHNLSADSQVINDTADWGQQQILNGMAGPLNSSGLSGWGNTDITRGVSQMPDGSFGASQQVIDAMKGLQKPGLDQARDSERARLAAMGITLGSDASNNSERVLGGTQNDADLKAILAGTQEYGNVFNRQLAQRQQGVDENLKGSSLATALRQAQAQEQFGYADANNRRLGALTDLKKSVNGGFDNFMSATPTTAPDIYKAATDSSNANAAAKSGKQQGQAGLLGAGLSLLGGVKGVGGLLGQGANWLGNQFGGGSDSWFGGFANNGDNFDFLANQGQGGGDVLGDFGADAGWW